MSEAEKETIEDVIYWNRETKEYSNYIDIDMEDAKIFIKAVENLIKENEELEFKLLARERGEAEFEVLVDTLKKENEELEKTIEQSLLEQKERDKYTHELEKRLEKLQKENKELKKQEQKYIIHLTDEQYRKVIDNAQDDVRKDKE